MSSDVRARNLYKKNITRPNHAQVRGLIFQRAMEVRGEGMDLWEIYNSKTIDGTFIHEGVLYRWELTRGRLKGPNSGQHSFAVSAMPIDGDATGV